MTSIVSTRNHGGEPGNRQTPVVNDLPARSVSYKAWIEPVDAEATHAKSKEFFETLIRRAGLLPNYLSQRLIDPVLPARSGFLKVIKNVSVNSQRDKLLGIRCRTLRREFRGLCGCRFKRRFGRLS